MPTSQKHQPINLEQVLNAFDHTLIVSEQLGWKHLKHEMLKIQRTHDMILNVFENNKLDIRQKFNAVGELVLHSYQDELTHAKAADAQDFTKKINNHNNNLHYARMLALILRDLSPKISDIELNKLIRARLVDKVHDVPHDKFYDTSPVKETKKDIKSTEYTIHKKPVKRVNASFPAKSASTKTTSAKTKTAISAKKAPEKKLSTAAKATKKKPARKTIHASNKPTKASLRS